MEGTTSEEEEEIDSNINSFPKSMSTEWACFETEWLCLYFGVREICRWIFKTTVQPLPAYYAPSGYGENCQVQPWTTPEPNFLVRLVRTLVASQTECILSSCRFSPQRFLQCCLLSQLRIFSTVSTLGRYVMIIKVPFVTEMQGHQANKNIQKFL